MLTEHSASVELAPTPTARSILRGVPPNHLLARALWPALLLTAIAFVVVDFVRHPYLGSESQASIVPKAHLTLWLAETEAAGESGALVREIADSLLLRGRPAAVGLLSGGSSQAVTSFLDGRRSTDQLLAVSSETLADLAQERTSTLPGEEPLRAARAQRLLARAVPIGVFGGEPLTIAVTPSSPVHDVGQLLAQLRLSAQAHVFAITDENWATDNLATLVQDAGVEGVVPYRVFSSAQDASLALAAGSADVVLASRGALLPDIRARRLRLLGWPEAAGRPPRSWVELLAAPGMPASDIAALGRRIDALTRDIRPGSAFGGAGRIPLEPVTGAHLRSFLVTQMARIAELQQIALRVERR